jgi:hypothetical protein
LQSGGFDRNERHAVSRTGHATQKARRLQFTRLLPRSDDTPSAPYPDRLERGLSDRRYFTGAFPSTGGGAGFVSAQQPAKPSVIKAEQSSATFPKALAVNPIFLLS